MLIVEMEATWLTDATLIIRDITGQPLPLPINRTVKGWQVDLHGCTAGVYQLELRREGALLAVRSFVVN